MKAKNHQVLPQCSLIAEATAAVRTRKAAELPSVLAERRHATIVANPTWRSQTLTWKLSTQRT